MKYPKGKVKFAYGKFEDLPYGAEEVKLYMVPGDPCIYIVPANKVSYSYRKINSKDEEDLSKYLIQIE